ncbi:Cystinosin/ERS1p repeat-containing protein, partial [Cynara cardunculus var. scolymus]
PSIVSATTFQTLHQWRINTESGFVYRDQHRDTDMSLLLGNGSNSSNPLSSYCVQENKPCIGWWVDEYFKDCLCNLKDQISFGLGIISLVCWGVAEIPQIITNFRTKSSHGVSLIFLLTWIAGDIFNLVGCLLEPATLPTQYYTAMLYTTSTVILVLQSLYYDHIYAWLKSRKADANASPEVEETKKPLKPAAILNSQSRAIKASPSQRPNYYYMSARSMAGSSTPPFRGCLWTTRSGPASAMAAENDSSSEDESSVEIPKTASQPRPIPRSVGYGAFFGASLNMPSQAKGLVQVYAYRQLLQDGGGGKSVYGQWLGWMMAAIYMGGRIPQIVLNVKRGSVEIIMQYVYYRYFFLKQRLPNSHHEVY